MEGRQYSFEYTGKCNYMYLLLVYYHKSIIVSIKVKHYIHVHAFSQRYCYGDAFIYGTKFNVIAFFSPFCRFFNRKLDIYCGFIPQVIFLISIFGYLVCEIFIKWIIFTVKDAPTAPNLLIGTACLLISLVFL